MSFRNKRTGAFQPFGGLFNTEKTSTVYRDAPQFVQNQTQATMAMAPRPQILAYRPQVAPINTDQQAFFDTAREYATQSMNRETPTIDTSAIEGQLGRTVDTSAITGLMGQRADMSGVLGMIGQGTNTSGLQGMVGQRADTGALQGIMGDRVDASGLEAAANAAVDTSELGGLMGQQNVARDIFQDFTTREVTPYLETQINDATDRALQNVNSLYARHGRSGSGAFADAAGRGVTAAAAPILQAQANQDAARQLQAAGLLGQAFEADRAADIGLADRRAAIEATNFGRQLQGQGVLANLANQGIMRDANIASQLAGYSESGLSRDAAMQNQIAGFSAADLNRDMAANQYAAQLDNAGIARDAGLAQSAAQFAAGDAARDAGLAGQLTDASRQQAMLAPTMQQMDMANMGLLAQIGAQQQAQQQAQINANLQYQQMMNQAQQQQFNNMVMASQLGEPYIGSTTVGDQGLFNTALGAGATLLGGAKAFNLFGL
jgi:hypothetical protein